MPVRKKKGERTVKISGTILPDQHRWIEEKIKKQDFYNISHVLQKAIRLLQKQDE